MSLYSNSGTELWLISCSTERGTRIVYWQDIYPVILSLQCDVLTILDCCHAGGSVLEPSRVKVLGANKNFSKEVIGTSGFQTTSLWGRPFSLAPLLQEVLKDHRQNKDLDSPGLVNEVTHMMKKHYTPGPGGVGIRGATNLTHNQLVPGRSLGIALTPLSR